MTGQTVSHYKIAEKIGEGGMGEVWKARDIHLDRWVALKTLPAEFVANESRRTRFLREARAASALNHPHIVTIHDFVDAGGSYFLVMEYIEGKPLDGLIPRKGLRLPELLRIAIPAADALAAAHKAGVVHRDVKPGNILVANDGPVKVLDFGLAKRMDQALPSEQEATRTMQQQTEEGAILGTVAYMSPEQAQGKPVDTRTDIFSFGAMLYEMATGERAFHGDSKVSTLSAVLKDEPKPPGDLPRDLVKIITRCLRKNPDRRMQSMADVKLALEELKEESESGALDQPGVAAPHRTKRLAWLAIPVIAAVAAGGLWLGNRSQPAPQQPAAFNPKPLTTYAGNEFNPTLSPDGNQVAFSWSGESQDNDDIYVRLVAGGAPLRLTTDPARDIAAAWSPDGTSIAFLRRRGNTTAGVYLVSPLGGAEREIGEAYDDVNLGARIGWTPDSKRVVIARMPQGEPRPSLFTLDVETREIKLLLQRPPDVYMDAQLTYSPDGRSFAFIRSHGSNTQEIYVAAGGSAPKAVTGKDVYFTGLAWTPDSGEIVYATGRGFQRLRVDKPGAAPKTVAAIAGANGLVLSRSGRLVYSVSSADLNLYLLELDRPGAQARMIASSTRRESHPQISPDGSRIALSSNRSGEEEIWIAGVDGSPPTRLTTLGGSAHSPAWSPDGKRIAFTGLKSGNRDVYVIDASGGGLRRLTDDSFEQGRPMWSRDGRSLYFYSLRGGRSETWKMPADGGQAAQITRNGGHRTWESADASSLFIEKFALAPGLFRTWLDGSAETLLLPDAVYGGCSLSRDGVFYVPRGDALPLAIMFHDLRTGASRQVGRIEKPVQRQTNYLSASWDGKRLVWSQIDSTSADLMLVENFR